VTSDPTTSLAVDQEVHFHVEPRRPWHQPSRTIGYASLGFVLAATAAIGVVSISPLAGSLGWFLATAILYPIISAMLAWKSGSRAMTDRMATGLVLMGFIAVMIPWVSIIVTVIRRGLKAFYLGYLTSDMLVTSPDAPLGEGGVAHAIVGTLLQVLMASLIAVPLGIIAAVYIVEVRGKATKYVRFFTQAMSGVPSIVAGLFVYATVIIAVTHKYSALAGSLALAILMLPTVARTAEEVLKVVSDDLRAASLALGATQYSTTRSVVLPAVRTGLITSAVLGVARVAGETAPLLLTSQGFVKFTTNVVSGPMASLPTYVFGALTVGTPNSVARAWAGSAVLLVLIFILFSIARLIGGRTRKGR
jgi:phosphate transport system permease protein